MVRFRKMSKEEFDKYEEFSIQEYAFIFDFLIYESYRNRGYGTATLLEVEQMARQ